MGNVNPRTSSAISLSEVEVSLEPGCSVTVYILGEKTEKNYEKPGKSLEISLSDFCAGIIPFKLWPGSVHLSNFCLQNQKGFSFKGKRIVEIGCGAAALVGLSIAKFLAPKSVVLTDREILRSPVSAAIHANGLQETCEFTTFDWGNGEDLEKFKNRIDFDIVVAAEIIYVEEQEPLINALDAVLSQRSDLSFPTLILYYKTRSDEDYKYFTEQILARFTLRDQIAPCIYVLDKSP